MHIGPCCAVTPLQSLTRSNVSALGIALAKRPWLRMWGGGEGTRSIPPARQSHGKSSDDTCRTPLTRLPAEDMERRASSEAV